jgi:hypothetical protein
MKITSFKSLVGETWALSDGFCVLGYFKSEAEARKRRREIIEAKELRSAGHEPQEPEEHRARNDRAQAGELSESRL